MLANNLNVFLAGIGGLLFFGSEETGLPLHLFRVVAIACVVGIFRQARRTGWHPYHLFGVAYIPVLLAWNYPPHERFTYPIFPLLMGGFATEVMHIAALARRAWRKPETGQRLAGTVFGLVCIGIFGFGAHGIWRGLYHDIPAVFSQDRAVRPKMLKAYRWIAANIPEGAEFLAYDDPSLFLYTGRRACGMHAPTRGITQEKSNLALDYFSAMTDLARISEYDYILLTGSDFLQDIRRLDRIEARRAIDRDQRTRTLYEDGKIAIRRVLR
jgi:hypothetical protein